jgi:hypothetical protein
MQLFQAGGSQLLLLELDHELLIQGAREAGYDCEAEETPRSVLLRLTSPEDEGPLLLFDASDPANTGWFSRCYFYVDGLTGDVLQTPFTVANQTDKNGKLNTRAISIQIRKELPLHFRLPGRQMASEKVVYAVLFNFLNALRNVGVGLCAPKVVRPLAGRSDAPHR